MKELIRERDITMIRQYQALLEACGIETHVKNESVALAGGSEIPIPDTFPMLCVVSNEDYERAWQLIREHRSRNEELAASDSKCKECGEVSPGNFDTCWSCEAPLNPKEEES